jgi:hypothetical protein
MVILTQNFFFIPSCTVVFSVVVLREPFTLGEPRLRFILNSQFAIGYAELAFLNSLEICVDIKKSLHLHP